MHTAYRMDLRAELSTIRQSLIERWRAGHRPYVTAAAMATVITFWMLRRAGVWSNPIDWLSAVRADQPLLASLLRVPLSILVPAPDLPVWGAVGQVAIIGALGELLLGRRRLLGLALGVQFMATMAGRIAGWLGPRHPYGLRPAAAFVRDTGPSAVVIAVGIALAVMLGTWRLLAIALVALAIEIVGLHTLAGREHLVAIAIGLVMGWWWRAARRRGAGRVSAAIFIVLAGVVASGVIDPTPAGRLQRIAFALNPFSPANPGRLAAALATAWFVVIASGLRRGQRSAWILALATVLPAIVAPATVRGAHGAAAIAVLVCVVLLTGRRSFAAPSDPHSLRRSAIWMASGITTVVVATSVVPDRLERACAPAITLVVVTIAAVACWWSTRPARSVFMPELARRRAQVIVERDGHGTLDYFALRDDKCWFFWGSSVVAYAVKGAVALVSPDPIGPDDERSEVWRAFLDHAASCGWMVTVLGASESWLSVYRAAGMRAMYIGDEAIVGTDAFHLDGGDRKGLRQAVNRVARNGYTVTFHDPTTIDDALRDALTDLLDSSRRGDAERGFSMTLGRAFARCDRGLLLAVSRDQRGRPVAFCQFVPQAGRQGWSLDVMRSERLGHPNGLLDHVIVETINYVRATGGGEIGLNFATMRALLAEDSPTRPQRVVRRVLTQASNSMQIESLWKFNAKFFPIWRPRYVVYPTLVDLPAAALAIAKAEAIWELPVLGRFIRPSIGDAARTGVASTTSGISMPNGAARTARTDERAGSCA